MKLEDTLRKGLWITLTTGATLAIGFLSFAGMFVLSSSLFWCGTAFVLAAAYESQVNSEGISRALDRMLDPNHLNIALVKNYLNDLLKANNDENNFLLGYRLKKQKIKKLNDELEDLEDQLAVAQKKYRMIKFFNLSSFTMNSKEIAAFVKVGEIKKTIASYKEKLDTEKNDLQIMELAFLRQLNKKENNNPSDIEVDIRKLFSVKQQKDLLQEIKIKKRLIRLSWLFVLGSGISSGLATISAMQAGIAVISVLSAIPGGIIITGAILAGAGYTFLMYQNISDMIQEFNGKWKNYFYRRESENESRATHILRVAGAVIAVGLGIFATVATAGTWWYAVKNGASILGAAETFAMAIQGISISLMTVPTFIFNARNSVKSVNTASKTDFNEVYNDVKATVKLTWNKENVLQFFNPLRIAEKLISAAASSILFIGHAISMAMVSDRLHAVPTDDAVALNTAAETLSDAAYLPKKRDRANPDADDEEIGHKHGSKILTALFLPVTLTVSLLKFCSAIWDWGFSGSSRNFKKSLEKMFSIVNASPVKKPDDAIQASAIPDEKEFLLDVKTSDAKTAASPKNADAYDDSMQRLRIIEACDTTIERLQGKSPAKVRAAQKIREIIAKNEDTDKETLLERVLPLSVNRYSIWQETETRSAREMKAALAGYKGPQQREMRSLRA